ncbi:3-oxoacyl-ACP reductase family protein [Luteibacter sp. E-22]|uniref:3-oxoacyl-ACP reductase family protein n=1 Tax=Luteibacter sp. E-22 TaxID=3404050 RepID=UPI003CF385D2
MTIQFLEGKSAFVTGGSRGIGAGIVRSLAAAGAHVTFTYASSPDAAQALVDEVRAAGGKAEAVRADSADEASLAGAIDDAARETGGLDILVNNAGVLVYATLDDTSLADFDRLFAINVRAVFIATKAAAAHLRNGGSIVNVGSVSADRAGLPGAAIYGASKGAIQAMTRGLARDLGPRGITVNNVQPGPIATDMSAGHEDMLIPMLPVGRLGEPMEVGALVAYLAGPQARYINGASLTIDGGFLS